MNADGNCEHGIGMADACSACARPRARLMGLAPAGAFEGIPSIVHERDKLRDANRLLELEVANLLASLRMARAMLIGVREQDRLLDNAISRIDAMLEGR